MEHINIVQSKDCLDDSDYQIIGAFKPSVKGFSGNLDLLNKILKDYFSEYSITETDQIEDSGIEIRMTIDCDKSIYKILVTSEEIIKENQ